jgi:hypothetical protein
MLTHPKEGRSPANPLAVIAAFVGACVGLFVGMDAASSSSKKAR